MRIGGSNLGSESAYPRKAYVNRDLDCGNIIRSRFLRKRCFHNLRLLEIEICIKGQTE
jgi:hypothetical protein